MGKIGQIGHRLKLVFRDTGVQAREAQLLMVASSLAYTTILSLIPLLAVSFAIFQAFGGLDKLYNAIEPVVLSNLAEGTSDEVIDKIRGFIGNARAGVIGIGGFVGLIVTSMSMLNSIEKAINAVWKTPINRTLFQRISTYWFFITLGPLAAAVTFGFASSTDIPIANLLPSWTGAFFITVGLFFILYKMTPSCRVNWKFALISSTVTAVFWNLARFGFNLYTSKVLTYNKIYGGLGAVPILLLWIYIIWVVTLLGAALNAALQKRLEKPEKALTTPVTTV